MSTRYRLRDAAAQWSAIIGHVRRGEAVELMEDDRTVARITPVMGSRDDRERQKGFWDTLERLRTEFDVDGLEVGPQDFEGLRDRSAGRDVRL